MTDPTFEEWARRHGFEITSTEPFDVSAHVKTAMNELNATMVTLESCISVIRAQISVCENILSNMNRKQPGE